MFFRLILLLSHYLVNGSFLCTDSTEWRKENESAGNTRPFWCMWALRSQEQLLLGEGRIIPLSARGVARLAAAWQREDGSATAVAENALNQEG